MTTNQTSTATNLQGPNLQTSSASGTQYFNNLYSATYSISANANDAIVAFFEGYAKNKTAGDNLAAAVVYTALAQNLDPMEVLSKFQNLPAGQLTNYLTAFLNSTRSPTSFLGIKSSTSTSSFVTRTILI
jgi:Rad3-related DNA helicase